MGTFVALAASFANCQIASLARIMIDKDKVPCIYCYVKAVRVCRKGRATESFQRVRGLGSNLRP